MKNEMTRAEMMKKIYNLDWESCETCPFADHCEELELFWGCGVWEEEMGDDL